MFLQLSKIPHFTTLQKFADRITGTVLERIITSFICLTDIKQIFYGEFDGRRPKRVLVKVIGE